MVPAATPLGNGHPAELAAPYDERVFKQATLFQIREQSGDRDIGFRDALAVVLFKPSVRIPFAIAVNLDETDATLDETARHQAFAAVRGGRLVIEAIEFPDMLWL